MTRRVGASTATLDLTEYERELTGFCYRMLGSAFDAEDAVQETLLRAWRSRAQFDSTRGSRRTWVYTIARNVCLDMLRSKVRRSRPVAYGAAAPLGGPLGVPLGPEHWVTPVPEAWVVDQAADPAVIVQQRESIRLAFVAALQVLPPKQRAVLILKDVLAWESGEIASVLGTSPQAVNSSLQRARRTMAELELAPSDVMDPTDAGQVALIERFTRAFESNDVAGLVSLMREDTAMTMPPFTWWLSGRHAICVAMEASDSCRGARLVTVSASGCPAFAQYRRDDTGVWRPWALMLLELRGGLIQELTTFLDADRMFTALGIPAALSTSFSADR